MTFRQYYLEAKKRLTLAGIDSPGFDASELVRLFFGLDRTGLALYGQKEAPDGTGASFLCAVEQRASHRPLQYIMGEWGFLSLSLKTGEGVLIPREDTAVLVQSAAKLLTERSSGEAVPLRGLDLCAGTGAVGLGLCSLLPQAEILCVELSSEAFFYLEQNLAAYPQYRASAVRGDVLSPADASRFPPKSFDFLLSNPPYIPREEILTLQPEVRREPVMALDGGEDGLTFYRAIAGLWLPLVKHGGLIALEIGEDQGEEVCAILSQAGVTELSVQKDLSGLDRCVTGVAAKTQNRRL